MSNQDEAVTTHHPGNTGPVSAELPESRPGTVAAIVPGSQLVFRVSEAIEMLATSRSECTSCYAAGVFVQSAGAAAAA